MTEQDPSKNTPAELSSNEIAAGGPVPGDLSLLEEELAISAEVASPGFFPSINAAEVADASRSAFFPNAHFTGSFNGPNQVYAWRSETKYQGCTYINNRRPGELYIVGGDFPPIEGPVPPGPFISKADATTGREIWRTYVDNANVTKRFIGNGNLNILDNGNIPFSWGTQVVLIDGDTGQILKHQNLPTGQAPAEDANFKHLCILPDRTLLLKCQVRPTGETGQGTAAIIHGIQKGLKQPPSYVVAVEPDTLEILDEIQLEEPSSAPHAIDVIDGRIVAYCPQDSGMVRIAWDPRAKKLSFDNWFAKPIRPGQTTTAAATLMGEWVAMQTNGAGSDKIASTIAVAHRDDASRMIDVFPFGQLEKGQFSFCMPKPGGDPENQMIYSADQGIEKVAGIKLDQKTGKLEVVFVVDNNTNTFQGVIGPKDKRVLLMSDAVKDDPSLPMIKAFWSGAYTERVTWRDAATGRLLAASDCFDPLTPNSLVTPGFGGRIYFPTLKEFIVMQVLPK